VSGRYRCRAAIGAGIVLGAIFIASGLGKIPYQEDFLNILLRISFIPAVAAFIIADALPWVELVAGLLLITGVAARLAAGFSTVLIAAFMAVNSWMIVHNMGHEPCGCLGGLVEPLEYLTSVNALCLDVVMLALAVLILRYYRGGFLDPHPWFSGRVKR